jgi:DNA-binding NarL/FixJ family response regulator
VGASASYLSQNTVEFHLIRVYRTLGVRAKSELVFDLAGGPVAASR